MVVPQRKISLMLLLVISTRTILAFIVRPIILTVSRSGTDDAIFTSRLNAYSDGDSSIRSRLVVNDGLTRDNISSHDLPPVRVLKNGGRITMVGSGPGDPDLLTLAAHRVLSDPDALVVSDRLVSKEILDVVKGEIRIARKVPGCADAAQEEVREMMIFSITLALNWNSF